MSSKTVRAIEPIGTFLSDFAQSFGRAQRAQAIMSRPDSYFSKRGTTQQDALRRVFEL